MGEAAEKLAHLERNQKLLMKATSKVLSEIADLKENLELVTESINLLIEIESNRLGK